MKINILLLTLVFYCVFVCSVNASTNDLKITLNSIKPSHDYICPVDSVLNEKVEALLGNNVDLSNLAKSKLLWQKSKAIFCKFGFSEDYLRQLKKITQLPIEEVNHDVLSIAVYDLTEFYYKYSQKKSCDFFYETKSSLINASQDFMKYLDMAEIKYCSEVTPVEQIKLFLKLLESHKGDNIFISNAYLNIGEIYSTIGQYNLAANTFIKQLAFIVDKYDIHWTYYAIATEFLDAGAIENSKEYFKKFEAGKDLFTDTQDYKVLSLILQIKFAYIDKQYDVMLALLEEFEPYQSSTQNLHKNNRMALYKAIACFENKKIQCINDFIANKDTLLQQTNETNLIYYYEFLIKYYISQGQSQLANEHFEKFIELNNTSLANQQDSVSILGFAELQQDLASLELGLVSAKLENSKIVLVLSSILILLLVAICFFVWHLKNKQKILSETDELTRINNRRAIFEQINSLKDSQQGNVHAIILFDLDDFKAVNDKYSHIFGDKALKHIVKLTKGNIRQQDLFGRVGGEEFVVCLKDLEKISAQIIVERIRKSFETNPMALDSNEKLHVTASFSIAYVKNSKSNFEKLYQKLDNALYKAKDLGRNRIEEV